MISHGLFGGVAYPHRKDFVRYGDRQFLPKAIFDCSSGGTWATAPNVV